MTSVSEAACGCRTCQSFYQSILSAFRNKQPPKDDVSVFESQVVEAINRYRERSGLRPLTMDVSQSLLARAHSQRMASWGQLVHASGYMECIAMIGGKPEQVTNLWMNSPPHRAILMSPNATRIAIGQYRSWHTARVF